MDTAATVTFKASKEKQLTSAQLSAYKIADYVNYGTAKTPVYGVKTAAGANRTKLAAALTAAGFQNVPIDGTTDLMAWAMNQKRPRIRMVPSRRFSSISPRPVRGIIRP